MKTSLEVVQKQPSPSSLHVPTEKKPIDEAIGAAFRAFTTRRRLLEIEDLASAS